MTCSRAAVAASGPSIWPAPGRPEPKFASRRMQPAVLGSRPPGDLPRCSGRPPRRERHESRPRDDRPRWRTHAGGASRGGHRSRAAPRLPSEQTVRRASAIAPLRWRGRPRAAVTQGRVHVLACCAPAVHPLITSSRSSCVATRDDVHEQRATLRRTPISSEVAPRATSEAPGSVTGEKMSPERPRSAAPPQTSSSTAAARATAAALSEAVDQLDGSARAAPGREERLLAVAVAGEVTTIARLKFKVSWTYHLNP